MCRPASRTLKQVEHPPKYYHLQSLSTDLAGIYDEYSPPRNKPKKRLTIIGFNTTTAVPNQTIEGQKPGPSLEGAPHPRLITSSSSQSTPLPLLCLLTLHPHTSRFNEARKEITQNNVWQICPPFLTHLHSGTSPSSSTQHFSVKHRVCWGRLEQ